MFVSSGRHPATGFSTIRASNNAFVHVANPLAIPCAFKANLGALPAKMLMMRRTDKHEMCRRPAYFCAGSHQFEVQGLCVFSANFEAMVHRGTDANPITYKATVNALLHFRAELSHGSSPMKELKGQNTSDGRLFLGFDYVLTDIVADRCNSSLRATGICRSVRKPVSNP